MNTFEPRKIDNEIIKELFKNSLKIISYGKLNFIPFIVFLDILTGTLLSSYNYIPLYNISINILVGPLILAYFILHIEIIRQIRDREFFSIQNILYKSYLILKNNFFHLKKYIFYYYIFSTIIIIISLPLFFYNQTPSSGNNLYDYISKVCIGTNIFFFFCFIFENKPRSHSILFKSLTIIYSDCNESQADMMVEKSSSINEKKLSLIKIWICFITILICLKFYIFFPFFVITCIAFQFCIWDYIFNNRKGLETRIQEQTLIDINEEGVIQG